MIFDENNREKIVALMQQLNAPEYFLYKDLMQKSEKLLQSDAIGEKEIQGLEDCLATGHLRNQKMKEVDERLQCLQEEIQEKTRALDLFSYRTFIQKKIDDCRLFRKDLINVKPHEIESYFQEKALKLKAFQEELPALFQEIENETKRIYGKFDEIVWVVKNRLDDIFKEPSLYPDLHETIVAVRSDLLHKIETLQEQFRDGKIGFEALRKGCYDLPYESDVILLRREFRDREKRLRVLRQETLKTIQPLQRQWWYQEILRNTVPALPALLTKLFFFFKKLQTPRALFEKATLEFEGSNRVFRELWIELEGFQKDVHTILQKSEKELQKKVSLLLPSLDQALDDLEEIMKTDKGVRPQLMLFYREKLSQNLSLDGLYGVMEEIERRFSFVRPFAFFMAIPTSKERQRLFRLSQKVATSIDEVTKFAKELQAVKVFEEERVDSLLEPFDREGLMGNGGLQELQKAAVVVEKAVLFDIGLLDMKALFHVKEEHLQKALLHALDTAKKHAAKGTSTLQEWARQKLPPDAESAECLQMLQHFCYLLG